MIRTPLESGTVITMANDGEYIVNRLLAEGGFSLLYEAGTVGGTVPVVIKEYFPAEGAYRNDDGIVTALSGYEDVFERNKRQFAIEGVTGGIVAGVSFQTISFIECDHGYAVMKKVSDDMCSLADLRGEWDKQTPLPISGTNDDRDPVFGDLTIVDYALRIVDSLLSVIDVVHKQGYLHLDISSHNVIWAGSNRLTGRNCVAFLADFGCAVPINDGVYKPEYRMSYSPGFAAPELQRGDEGLSFSTDVYSVGMILFYMCVGNVALEICRNRRRQIQRETAYLSVPPVILAELRTIIEKATTTVNDRYQSAIEMQQQIQKLMRLIPQHPINLDNTKSFNLYSLKSMIEGNLDSQYGWADELRNRRGVISTEHLNIVYEGISRKRFRTDEEFLRFMLPEEIYGYLNKRLNESPDRGLMLKNIMTGRIDSAWKSEICEILSDYGSRRLLQICRTVLTNEDVFFADAKTLFLLLGDEGRYLRDCYQHCDVVRYPYIGLALFVVFALFGETTFKNYIQSARDAKGVFKPLT